MPVYPYACSQCGYQFETEQKMTDKKLVQCPECGEFTLQRLITNTTFVLKGGGWSSMGYSKEIKDQK